MEPRRAPTSSFAALPAPANPRRPQALGARGTSRCARSTSARFVRDQKLHEGWDDETDSYILDEDQLCDALEERMEAGGVVVDYHGADLFPERWFDLVVVLRTDNDVLYPRLEGRQYAPKKITENVEAEIMQVILDDQARDAYAEEIVLELQSNSVEEMEANVARLAQWVSSWRPPAET